MPNYILTGTPGSGKTAVLRQLELSGHTVVEEAATDVIALGQALGVGEPWREAQFIEQIVTLQRRRQRAVDPRSGIVFFDRSPACTLALSRYAALPAPRCLIDEIERMAADGVYERSVFFVRNQGFVEPTAARRISLEESLVFEQVHEETYRALGFELIDVPAAPLPARVELIETSVQALRNRRNTS